MLLLLLLLLLVALRELRIVSGVAPSAASRQCQTRHGLYDRQCGATT